MKERKVFLVSSITILLCFIVLMSALYVYFANQKGLVHHLSSGDLEATLVRTNLIGNVYGSDGMFHEYSNSERIDFSQPSDKNLLDLDKDSLFVPGTEYNATLVVENNADVVFGYYIEVIVDDESSKEFCEQLQITISSGDKKVQGKLSTLLLGSETDYVSIVEVGSSSTFNIEISFIDDSNINNNVMAQNAYFDLVVHAVQIVK